MPVTLRGRTVSGDNLAVGQASGTERTIAGSAPPAEKVGGKDNIAFASAHPTGNISDNQQVGVVTVAKEKGKNQ
jgi:hypothetical protein